MPDALIIVTERMDIEKSLLLILLSKAISAAKKVSQQKKTLGDAWKLHLTQTTVLFFFTKIQRAVANFKVFTPI